jgi:hypothetical protein
VDGIVEIILARVGSALDVSGCWRSVWLGRQAVDCGGGWQRWADHDEDQRR